MTRVPSMVCVYDMLYQYENGLFNREKLTKEMMKDEKLNGKHKEGETTAKLRIV